MGQFLIDGARRLECWTKRGPWRDGALKLLGAAVVLAVMAHAPGALAQEETPRQSPLDSEFLQYQFLQNQFPGYPSIFAALRAGGRGTGAIPSPVDRAHMIGQQPELLGLGTYPAAFDLRSLGYVSGVKDQGQCNDCWTFAAIASLESNILKAGGSIPPAGSATLGFAGYSENHLNVRSGFDWGPCGGGNADIATAYMTRWGNSSALAAGPVYETDDPYTSTKATSVSGLSPRAHLQEVLHLPDRANSTDNDNYKFALQNYGALFVGMYVDDGITHFASSPYWNQATSSYYYNGSATGNHAVALVGWDDNYAAGNFSTAPPGNGAFIAKNQWGTTFGKSGYFYISYYDSKLRGAAAFRNPEGISNYARSYLYDPYGQVSSFGYGTDTAWGASVFTAAAAESLQAVAFVTSALDSRYEIYIYTGVSGAPTTGSLEGGAVNTTGSISYPGYHTVKLSRPVSLTAGQTFAAVIKFTTPGYNYPVPVQKPMSGYISAATASAGQSYISSNGTSWKDTISMAANATVDIRAFTAAATVPNATVIEFYNSTLDNYFITADSAEAAAIDGGSAGPGWSRTGNTFKAGGPTAVCRFYGSLSPGPNSHFYTIDPMECQSLKDAQFAAGDPRRQTVKSWNFESLDFLSTVPLKPSVGDPYCPGGLVPVYRAYNNGFARGVDSNHRITGNLAAIQEVVARGWTNEGIVMCAPQ